MHAPRVNTVASLCNFKTDGQRVSGGSRRPWGQFCGLPAVLTTTRFPLKAVCSQSSPVRQTGCRPAEETQARVPQERKFPWRGGLCDPSRRREEWGPDAQPCSCALVRPRKFKAPHEKPGRRILLSVKVSKAQAKNTLERAGRPRAENNK